MAENINLEQFIIMYQRGGQKITYKGFGYNFKETLGSFKFWRCCKRGCKGLIKTTLEYDLVSKKVHSHPSELLKAND